MVVSRLGFFLCKLWIIIIPMPEEVMNIKIIDTAIGLGPETKGDLLGHDQSLL